MAGSLNKVMVIGHLGQSPDVKSMPSGDKMASFSMATSESWKDKATGDRKERTQWHKVVVFNTSLVGIVESYVKKGSKVFIEGQLETRKWTDKDGRDQYVTEIVLRQHRGTILLLDAGKGGVPPAESPDDYGTTTARDPQNHPSDTEDEIPF